MDFLLFLSKPDGYWYLYNSHRKILRDNIKGISMFPFSFPLVSEIVRYRVLTWSYSQAGDQVITPLYVTCWDFPKLLILIWYRRLARRGGVKRISATVYDETRAAMKQYLEEVRCDSIALLYFTSCINWLFSLPSFARSYAMLWPMWSTAMPRQLLSTMYVTSGFPTDYHLMFKGKK